MSNSARRHHRVAKKQVEHNNEKGIFIPEAHAKYIFGFFIFMMFVVFFKGMILSRWFCECEEE